VIRGRAGMPCGSGAGSKVVDWEVEPARRHDWIEADRAPWLSCPNDRGA
jgi:hypothetical protein